MTITDRTISRDGTPITFDRQGQGPPLILVVGAFNDRRTGAPLAAFLASRFTVFCYDRRGRGDSGDGPAYAVEHEVADLQAVIAAAGGSAGVLGYSSGAVLALEAAAAGASVTRLALYELPPAQPAEHAGALGALIAAGRRGDAVEYFQRRMVGIPEAVVAQLRHAPFRPALEAMAHTLVYEATLMNYGPRLAGLANIRQTTLAVAGGASPPAMRQAAEALARSLPDARTVVLEGATHDLVATVLGPVLEQFFEG
jgi:pimeloyl-ACP methyl ester carboxylesterase